MNIVARLDLGHGTDRVDHQLQSLELLGPFLFGDQRAVLGILEFLHQVHFFNVFTPVRTLRHGSTDGRTARCTLRRSSSLGSDGLLRGPLLPQVQRRLRGGGGKFGAFLRDDLLKFTFLRCAQAVQHGLQRRQADPAVDFHTQCHGTVARSTVGAVEDRW